MVDKSEKEMYHKELEEQVRIRKEMEAMEKQNSKDVSKMMVRCDHSCDKVTDCVDNQEEEGCHQWGRPGPGGAYWRNSAITGQGFFDKMVQKM